MTELPQLTRKENDCLLAYFTCCAGNKVQSYKKAYNCANSNEATIQKEAYKFFKNPKITPWLLHYEDMLQKHNEDEIKYSRREFFEDLQRIRSKTEDSSKTVSVALKATELMGKTMGYLKEDVAANSNVVIQMGDIQKDGKTLNFQVGEKLDSTSSDT